MQPQLTLWDPRPAGSDEILSADQINALRTALEGRLLAVCFGAGVDSTAMLVALRVAGLKPDVITFADTKGEKPETIAHCAAVSSLMEQWGWPRVDTVCKVPLATTGYDSLFGNCEANSTLPSLAFGLKSCSVKWKQIPQDQFLKGVKTGPNARPVHPLWLKSIERGEKIVKLIGYDCGRADLRRSGRLKETDGEFDFFYPLQLIGWSRPDCISAIAKVMGAHMVPVKSACYYCPASKTHELYWLAAKHPDLLENALRLEHRALTGRHSRFDEVEFGDNWENLVKNADRFPSSKTTIGLGRSFAWNHWARINNVVDEQGRVRRDEVSRERFLRKADALRNDDNALDSRNEAGCKKSTKPPDLST